MINDCRHRTYAFPIRGSLDISGISTRRWCTPAIASSQDYTPLPPQPVRILAGAGKTEVLEVIPVSDGIPEGLVVFVATVAIQITTEPSRRVSTTTAPINRFPGDLPEPVITDVIDLVPPNSPVGTAVAIRGLVVFRKEVVEQFPQTDGAFGPAK